MRMLSTHYGSKAVPATVKKKRAEILHVLPPLNGLSEATRYTTGDPLTASTLVNFVIEDDRIKCRAGYHKLASRGTLPIWHLIPFYGTPLALAAASNNELWNAQNGNLLRGGFTGNDWHWTSFSNLAELEYTVMVNGRDGVWSWDGGATPDGTQLTVTAISKANPAVCTVADTTGLASGMDVHVAGALGEFTICNGNHIIGSVTPTTFALLGIDTSALTGTSGAGITATPLGSFVKESVTVNPADPWINPDQFQIVLSHMNRLWFADNTNLAVYYLPLMQKTGEVTPLPLNVVFRRGGSIRAMYTWTLDGGAGMNDQLVIFSSNGECVIYQGTDPDGDDFQLTGIFRFDSPMSKHSVAQYGGELYVLISTGLVPLSTMLRAESEQLGQSERNVTSRFLRESIRYRDWSGWQTFLNPSTGRLFCNLPQGGANKYLQLVRHMPKNVWTSFEDIPARCWNWIDPVVYFGDDSGNVYEMHPSYQSDDGKAIRLDVQMAWNSFKTPAKKHFLVLQTYMTSDGNPQPIIDMKVDYDYSPGINVPDITTTIPAAEWDEATWDVDYWAGTERAITNWNGIAPLGHVGAIRMSLKAENCSFAVNGWDVVFEKGVFGP